MILLLALAVSISIMALVIYKKGRQARLKHIATLLNQKIHESRPKTRDEVLEALSKEAYDVVIIGGGATGSGCALDAATRGLNVVLIEANDFGSGTSSKSTKLLHGGVRYLEKAASCLSISQLLLVFQALEERWTIMQMAPFLSSIIPIMIPLYSRYKTVYYWILLKFYDKLSGFKSLGRSHFISAQAAVENFGRIITSSLCGAVVYKDGSFDDARMNVLLAATAAAHGATVINHIRFMGFEKDMNGKITGASCLDVLTNQTVIVNAKGFISAAGPFTDEVRALTDKDTKPMMVPSFGTHIVLSAHFCPYRMGLVDSSTSDGRMLFILPWKDNTLVGATEVVRKLVHNPSPTEEEIEFLLEEVQKYTSLPVSKKDICSAWSGIRPLAKDPTKERSEEMVRSHEVRLEKENVVVITGGKWTTFRKMAEDTINSAVASFGLTHSRGCVSKYLKLLGSHGYTKDMYYEIKEGLGISLSYAKHLLKHYGARAYLLKEYLEKYPETLSEKYLFKDAEVVYCIDYEYACTISDVINGRFMVGYFDVQEAYRMVDRTALVMSEALGWSLERRNKEIKNAILSLNAMGLKKDVL